MGKAVSTLTLQKYKEDGRKIVCLTAYDYSTAKILDRAGVDVILVGDSLAMVALGHKTTHAVTVEEMLHHTKAVTRGAEFALVVADLPFMSYQVDITQAITNAGRFVKEAQAQAVKLEGASEHNIQIIERLVSMGIPVMGHLGFTPQSIHGLGGTRVQARNADDALKLLAEAKALEKAGVFAVVLEMVPTAVARAIAKRLTIPVIGIGAGVDCDGQILVTDDLLGKYVDFKPRFVRRYASLDEVCTEAIRSYAQDVMSSAFPTDTESFAFPEEEEKQLLKKLDAEPTKQFSNSP
ncbi:3-methyl-2-oxobutanoate hydroxymethyltransferase [Candidatus Obscuribacterales bacterium]|nr:3-methyl-2-oxobutanoate hydroxymethyltransferase [Candidatus Obscuribacterales bacterium]MBX3149409.1 3-methyl-2-oxobutanoate hydroxymethyltransferase [Candidatus Obscuribacterales bacterium]